MSRHAFLPEAEEEMNEAARFYEERSPGLGRDFLDDVEQTAASIATYPSPGASFPTTSEDAFSGGSPLEFSMPSKLNELS